LQPARQVNAVVIWLEQLMIPPWHELKQVEMRERERSAQQLAGAFIAGHNEG
jgi:hypothetical protein